MRRVSSCRRRKGECLGQGSLATGRARSRQVELKGAALACFEMRPEAEERESGHDCSTADNCYFFSQRY